MELAGAIAEPFAALRNTPGTPVVGVRSGFPLRRDTTSISDTLDFTKVLFKHLFEQKQQGIESLALAGRGTLLQRPDDSKTQSHLALIAKWSFLLR